MFSGCISKIIHLNYPVPCDSASHVHGFSMPRRENIKQNTYYMHCLSVVLKTRSIGYDSHQQGFMYLNGISLNKPKINIHHFELHHSNLPKKSGCTSGWLCRWWKASLSSWWSITMSRTLVVKSIVGIDLQVSILTLTYLKHWNQHIEDYWGIDFSNEHHYHRWEMM